MGIVRHLLEKRTKLEWRFCTRKKALVPSAMAQAFLVLTSAPMGNGTVKRFVDLNYPGVVPLLPYNP